MPLLREPGAAREWPPERLTRLVALRPLPAVKDVSLSFLQVTMPGEPVDMACGVDHMVTLAKSFI